MITTFHASDLERFRALIVRCLGLQFEDAKLGFLAEVLRRRLEATKQEPAVYLALLDTRPAVHEVGLLAQELTVAETYFFRHLEQYRAFAEVALPDRVRAVQSAGVRVSVVSAACASGEEPYSLAMTVREAIPDRVDAVSILGVDINAAQIEKAARGRFSPWVLRDTPADVRRRWFRADGREFVLDDVLRSAVCFQVSNLADENGELWRPYSHDVVFCRNVLMYFAPASARALVGRIARSLRPGGYLFLGHAETLRGLSADFHLRHTHGTFYYQKKDHAESNRGASAATGSRATAAAGPMSLTGWAEGAGTWIDTIGRASERIRSLAESPAHSGPSPNASRSPRAAPARELGPALELLREERFAEALDVVEALPAETDHDAEVLLLRAVLLTHSGQLAGAERICHRLLAINELNAEAHYLLALCREGAGDHASSCYHDQVAIHLDPSFAMAHLHLGLLARRSYDSTTARRELEQAITLLEHEDASRILLFGGGFTRDALVGLCRGELLRSGERP
jgi:chemotaxis protein methyltransferase CheR